MEIKIDLVLQSVKICRCFRFETDALTVHCYRPFRLENSVNEGCSVLLDSEGFFTVFTRA